LTPINWVKTGSGANTFNYIWSRASLSVGLYICKYSQATLYTCGYINGNNFQPSWVPNANAVFIKAGPSGGPDMSNSGDSGGPIFWMHSAIGITSGEWGWPPCVCDVVFSATDFATGPTYDQIVTWTP
jgi:Trypsin